MEEEQTNSSVIEMLRKELSSCSVDPYFYQSFNLEESPDFPNPIFPEITNPPVLRRFDYLVPIFSSFEFPNVPVVVGDVKPCRYSELETITDFKPESLIQTTYAGRLFYGVIIEGSEMHPVIVKTWDFLYPLRERHMRRPFKFCDEIELLTDAKANGHPNLVKLYKYCYERRFAAVYDVKLAGFLSNVLLDDTFGWDKRMDVAIQLADLLVWLHEKRTVVGSVTASSIMIDEAGEIKVYDFGCVAYHVDEDSEVPFPYGFGRITPEREKGVWTMKSDVYMFGVLLMELISKQEYDDYFNDTPPNEFLVDVTGPGGKRLVGEIFQEVDDQTASDITQLTSRCLNLHPDKRPMMKEVLESLKNLRARDGKGGKRKRDETESGLN